MDQVSNLNQSPTTSNTTIMQVERSSLPIPPAPKTWARCC